MTKTLKSQARSVLGVALGLRLIVLALILLKFPWNWLYTRGMEMGLLAKSLLAGQGLSSPFGTPTGPTAFIAPGYPVFVAAVFRLFGVYSFPSVLAILFVHLLLNLLAIWLILHLCEELFGRRVALVAGWIWACSIPLLWLPTIFWDTSISVCALLAIVNLALRIRRRPSMRLWITMGVACGLIALINPALIPSLAVAAGWAAWQTRRVIGLGTALLAGLIVFSPWPIRNAYIFHAFVPLRTTVGFELWMGNHPGSTGYLDESLFPMFNSQELTDYKRMGEIAYTNNKAALAKAYIQQYPARFAALTLRRIVRFWTGAGTQNGSVLFVLHAAATTLLGAFGLFLLSRTRRAAEALLLLGPLLLFPMPYYITHAEFRYRLVIDPLMTILAAYALVWLFSRDRADILSRSET